MPITISRTWTLEQAVKILAEITEATPDLDRNGLYAGTACPRWPLSEYDAPAFVASVRFTEEVVIPNLTKQKGREAFKISTRLLKIFATQAIEAAADEHIYIPHSALISAFIFCRVPFKRCRRNADAEVTLTKEILDKIRKRERLEIPGGISIHLAEFSPWCAAREGLLHHV